MNKETLPSRNVQNLPTRAATVGNGSKYMIWRVSLDDDKPQLVADLGSGVFDDVAFSPDGKHFAFIRGRWINDAVLINGLK